MNTAHMKCNLRRDGWTFLLIALLATLTWGYRAFEDFSSIDASAPDKFNVMAWLLIGYSFPLGFNVLIATFGLCLLSGSDAPSSTRQANG